MAFASLTGLLDHVGAALGEWRCRHVIHGSGGHLGGRTAAHAEAQVGACRHADRLGFAKLGPSRPVGASHLKIYLRAYSRVEAYDYLDAGEELIYRDTLDSSLRLTGDVLKTLGESDKDVVRAIDIYRERDEVMVRDMAKHRGDTKGFLSAARESHRSLDELMRSDIAAANGHSRVDRKNPDR